MRLRNRARTGAGCVALIAALAGCGTATQTTTTITGSSLTVYASMPLNGPESAEGHDVLDAEQLALQQAGGKVGNYTIRLVALGDATSAGWSPRLIAADARTVIQRADAVAYIGETDLNASAQSIPLTNADDLLQVSPYDTAIGLTEPTKAVPAAPNVYYEALSTNGRTFGRVVPNDNNQAKAQLQLMQTLKVKKLFIAENGRPNGDEIALAVQEDAHAYGIATTGPTRSSSGLAQSGADALFYGGVAGPAAVQMFNGALTTSPKLKLFGASGLYTSSFASQLIPPAQSATYLSEPGFTRATLPAAGAQFLTAFKAAYHHAPWTQAIFAYTAMQAVLQALKQAGGKINDRQADINRFFGARKVSSPLGTYSITKSGDISLASGAPYIFSRVKGGKLVAYKGLTVQP